MNIVDSLMAKVRGFFKRKVIYHFHYTPFIPKVEDETFKPLDYHLPIEIEFGNRLMKVER